MSLGDVVRAGLLFDPHPIASIEDIDPLAKSPVADAPNSLLYNLGNQIALGLCLEATVILKSQNARGRCAACRGSAMSVGSRRWLGNDWYVDWYTRVTQEIGRYQRNVDETARVIWLNAH